MREWLIRAGLMAGVPVFLVAGLELIARLAGLGYDPSFWIAVPGLAAMATNDDFGRRFFGPGLVRTPAPAIVSNAKTANTRRVFLLGESAAMGFPEPAIGLAPMLEHMLRESQPHIMWEVHNAAMTAINSHVTLPIARDCTRLAPDVFIVLAGNNEAVGPYGPGTVFGQSGMPLCLARASTYAGSTRLGQLFTRAIQSGRMREWRGMEMFSEQRISATNSGLARMYDSFRQNLIDIVRTGKQAGAQVLLVTVPVNLRDQPPFASEPGEADDHYRRGQDLLERGQTEPAAVEFRVARDLDLLRFRADSTINDIIRATAKHEGAHLVDAEQQFGLAGDDLFWEHVHFNPLGTHRIATRIAQALGVPNIPSFEQLRQTLPVTQWDERNSRLQIAALLRRPPFAAQHGTAERIAKLTVLEDIPAIHAKAQTSLEAAVRRRPHDLHLLGRYASLLRESGQTKQSADVYARMLQLLPGRKAWHVSRGAALSDAGLQQQAMEAHRAALTIDPQLDLAHFGIALAEARSSRHDKAVRHFSDALRLNPAYGEAAYNLAGSLSALGQAAEARRQLERAVEIQPHLAVAHAALGQMDARERRIDDAIAHYRQATRGDTPLPDAHYDLGILLARRGQLSEAIAEYRRALELRPAYPEALNNLGIALARSGDTTAAENAFTRALSVYPSFEPARLNLERIRRSVAVR